MNYWTFESISQELFMKDSARVIAGIVEWYFVLVRSIARRTGVYMVEG